MHIIARRLKYIDRVPKQLQFLYFRPFFVAALKELPDDPAALKRAAKNKRKQKEAATEESGTSVRSMMTGVKSMMMMTMKRMVLMIAWLTISS